VHKVTEPAHTGLKCKRPRFPFPTKGKGFASADGGTDMPFRLAETTDGSSHAQGISAENPHVGNTGHTGTQFRLQLRALWEHLPDDAGPTERLALLALFMLDNGGQDGVRIAQADLAELVGCSAKTIQRTLCKSARKDHVAVDPTFWGDDGTQTANSYAVLALPPVEAFGELDSARPTLRPIAKVHPPDNLTRGGDKVADQQKEIPEEKEIETEEGVDNPTDEDRAALAAAVREFEFPHQKSVPDPEPGSLPAKVRDRFGWRAYRDVLGVLESREGRAAPYAALPALQALLALPERWEGVPGAWFRGTFRNKAAAGPELPPDPLEARRLKLIALREQCVGNPERYGQLSRVIYELGREIVKEKARTA
jgi:hypothetical protein